MTNKIKPTVVAFLGETFSNYKSSFYYSGTSGAFIQSVVGNKFLFVASCSKPVLHKPVDSSTIISDENFYYFPVYNSTQDFVIKCIFNRGFYRDFVKRADEVISRHSNDVFWIRSPSIGSLVFGLRVISAKQRLIHHMCADASNTWRDKKYSGLRKIPAFLMSLYINKIVAKICKYPMAINLATGDKLEKISRRYSPAKSFQFVDLMVRSCTKKYQNTKNIDPVIKVLFVGRMVEDKGIYDLITAANGLGPRFEFTFVGGGPDLDGAIRLTQKFHLTNRINFVGQVPFDDLHQYFDACNIVVAPSNNHYEGFPRVIMEAWAHEKPIIVSNVGGVNAFVKHRKNGIITPPGDIEALVATLNDLVNQSDLLDQISSGAILMKEISSHSYWASFTHNKILQLMKE